MGGDESHRSRSAGPRKSSSGRRRARGGRCARGQGEAPAGDCARRDADGNGAGGGAAVDGGGAKGRGRGQGGQGGGGGAGGPDEGPVAIPRALPRFLRATPRVLLRLRRRQYALRLRADEVRLPPAAVPPHYSTPACARSRGANRAQVASTSTRPNLSVHTESIRSASSSCSPTLFYAASKRTLLKLRGNRRVRIGIRTGSLARTRLPCTPQRR
eukprot:7381232-Prymnesium_polylepis.2